MLDLTACLAIITCLTYLLFDALPEKSYKSGYAIPPALHGDDVFYYSPSFTLSGSSVSFSNTAFANASAHGFLSGAT
ncbi:hypothetical protein B0H11DRAFT_2230952 [Mycena galericulata]|nr:hypothetical protein B0H11DRAFT_2230952 [Mycena galericulata]